MFDLIVLLFVGGILLALAPQIVGVVAGKLVNRFSRLAGMATAVAVAPAVFWWIAIRYYSPNAESGLQTTSWAPGRGYVADPDLGLWVHAGVALLIQLWLSQRD